jgi:hypothetical protein
MYVSSVREVIVPMLLAEEILALEVISIEEQRWQFGCFVRLPAGTSLEVCGTGLSGKTIRVRWGGGDYLVLRTRIEGFQGSSEISVPET